MAKAEVAPELTNAARLLQRIDAPVEDHHDVNIGVRKRISPSLRSEQDQTCQASAIDSLKAVPEFGQDLVHRRCHSQLPSQFATDHHPPALVEPLGGRSRSQAS